MPLGQAFAFAFGVAFVVLGLLYVTSRAAGRDRTASVLSALLTGLFVSMMVWVGTFALLMSEPNVLIGVGMAILAYASAFRTGFGAWRHLGRTSSLSSFKAMFLISCSANVIAAFLSSIGCVIYGGPVGVLGFFVALYWLLVNMWLLKGFTSREASEQHPASTN